MPVSKTSFATHALDHEPTQEGHIMKGEVYSVDEAADYLGVSKHLMNKWRMAARAGEGPDWVRLGKRRVGYVKADLDAFIQRNRGGPAR